MMYKNKRVRLCFSLLVLMVFAGVGSAFGGQQSGSELLRAGESYFSRHQFNFSQANLETQSWLTADTGLGADSRDQSILLAQGGEKDAGKKDPQSPECRELAKDPMANVGEVLRAGCEPTLAQMSALMDNPLGNVAMWFNQVDFYLLQNPDSTDTEANKTVYTGIFQFPKGISKDWNIINRLIYQVISMPLDQDKLDSGYGDSPGTVMPPTGSPPAPIDIFRGRTTGFGDLYYVGLFSPKAGIKHDNGASSVWGVGFDAGFPTASEEVTGVGKYTAGPSALYCYLGKKWKFGTLLQQYWSYTGHSDRDDVNLTNLQYFYYYSLSDTMSIGAAPNIIANWEQSDDNRFTVPVGLGINKTITFGKLPVRFVCDVYYSVITPDDVVHHDWNVRLIAIPAIPSGLIPFLD
jgi:hypothetical protein